MKHTEKYIGPLRKNKVSDASFIYNSQNLECTYSTYVHVFLSGFFHDTKNIDVVLPNIRWNLLLYRKI